MCGILGFTGKPTPGLLEKMSDALIHRGPDDSGFWSGDGISLGMRRLAIIDPATGQQPVTNETGTLQVVFNGEIYNHVELRQDLEARGHRFRSRHSDTEVLVHLYEEWGDGWLERLNGMFAIALWDTRTRTLSLARDRCGIKPLYYWQHGSELLFASEIKAILRHPDFHKSPDFEALRHYFTFKNIPSPLSAFQGIRQLRAGERLEFREGTLRLCKWWSPDTAMADRSDAPSEAQAALHIRELLSDSVRLQMRSDVTVGAYLSGGVDSSAVVALMASHGARNVKTFTLTYEEGFENKTADREFAKQVSTLCGTDHHELCLREQDLLDSLDSIVEAFDEPFSGVTSTYFLTRLISKHVKVALSGDGADELFGSYLAHRVAGPLAILERLNRDSRSPNAEEQAVLAPWADRREYLEGLLRSGDESARRMALYLWDECGKTGLFSEKMKGLLSGPGSDELVRSSYAGLSAKDPVNRALEHDFRTLLCDQVLPFVDRLSMAHSVEVRPPFLDHRLVEYAASLPGRFKIKDGRTKHILKEALRGLVPDPILDRPKEGFVLPVNDWLSRSLRVFARETLSEARLGRHGLLESGTVRRLLEEHESGKFDRGARIWNLICFQRWWEKYFG